MCEQGLGEKELPSGVWRTQGSCTLLRFQETEEAIVSQNAPNGHNPQFPLVLSWVEFHSLTLFLFWVGNRKGPAGYMEGFSFLNDSEMPGGEGA